jgi:tRNA-uridine 2-sulfurtransferase
MTVRVLVAMSGGVDSSVAAALLVEQGYDVTGVHLKVADAASPDERGRVHGCCGVADADDARRVAQVLDIPFYVWNLTERFGATVVKDFISEYERGRTPNPCVRCNEQVKFGTVLHRGLKMGFDFVATGHYARVTHTGEGARLFRGIDGAKDQSYVLATLGRDALDRTLFPVGDRTKPQTREIARSLGLRTAEKPESFDICFVPDGNAGDFVERSGAAVSPGPLVDSSGTVVGEHRGIHRYTVGQRKGLGLATHERRFVLEVDAARNAIVVGAEELLGRHGLVAEEVSWIAGVPPGEANVLVQIRAHGEPVPAKLETEDPSRVHVAFERPVRGIAPGQLAGFYRRDEVLGGGTISHSIS